MSNKNILYCLAINESRRNSNEETIQKQVQTPVAPTEPGGPVAPIDPGGPVAPVEPFQQPCVKKKNPKNQQKTKKQNN